MNPTLGTNAIQFPNQGGSLKDIEARIKEFENPTTAAPTPPPAPEPTATPAEVGQLQTPTPPTATPAEATTVEVPQQFKDKDGKLDEEKLQKSNEHLRKGIEDREAKLLKLNKELREKFRQSGAALNQEKSKAEAETSFAELLKGGKLTPEVKQKLAEEIEKDPIEGMIAINRLIARQETEPYRGAIQNIVEERAETNELKELDSLVRDGHDWIVSEGLGRFEQAFRDRPWLRQSTTPYKDALRFIDVPGQQPPVAQVGPKTPILGASRAVPPPSPVPPVSPDQQLNELSQALNAAIRNKDYKTAGELEAKMDAAYKGRFQQ